MVFEIAAEVAETAARVTVFTVAFFIAEVPIVRNPSTPATPISIKSISLVNASIEKPFTMTFATAWLT